jgi:uncharacterized repeat protein (TIGR01451 family)
MFAFIGRSFARVLSLGGVVAGLLVFSGPWASPAVAVVPGAAWSVQSFADPTNFVPGKETPHEQEYRVYVTNIGSRPSDGSPVVITDTLPPGLVPVGGHAVELKEYKGNRIEESEGGACTVVPAQCTYEGALPAGDILEMDVSLAVPSSTVSGPVTNSVSVTGGGAATVSVSAVNAISATPAPFMFEDFGFGITGLDGAPDTQAGGHPYALSTTFAFTNEHIAGPGGVGLEYNSPSQGVKDVVADLPLGFAGSALSAPRCPESDLVPTLNHGNVGCPADTQVGNVTLRSVFSTVTSSLDFPNEPFNISPLYNMVPERGYAAEFAFAVAEITVVHLFVNVVHTSAGYALRVTSPDAQSPNLYLGQPAGFLSGLTLTLFGDPVAEDGGGGGVAAPSFTNPTDCSGEPLTTTMHVDTWENKGRVNTDGSPDFSDPSWLSGSQSLPAVTGCSELRFTPSLSLVPESAQADSPTGLTVDTRVPQAPNNDYSLATPDLRSAVVSLPAGLSISPGVADGLQACTDAQLALESTRPAGCPAASQIGTAVARTPVLGEPLVGQVFVGSPNCGPCSAADAQGGSLFRLFLQLQAPSSGIVIKVPATVSVDPGTGQLTTSFVGLPQQPVEDLVLSFKGGPRAPLATPQSCGSYTTQGVLTPWSAPQSGPPATPSSSFAINGGCGVGFAPAFAAGSQSSQAGAFGPFSVSFSRGDQDQELGGVSVTVPPGLLAVLKGVERCPEPQASQGACGPNSLVGHATAGAGAGSHPFYTTGQVFLTGPYKGAPFGLSIVVPAVAGPFNLGTIVVRAAVSVDPHTAQITVVSDPLPTMVDGVPLRVKTVNVSIDREHFMFNPTNCTSSSTAGALTSVQGATANVSGFYQVANCATLPFKPVFSVSTQAATSKHSGASLLVKGAFPTGDANLHSVAVVLPKQLPARLTTIQQACTEAQFAANPAGCPAGSDIGMATASTPILTGPVSGPVYLVSHGGAAFPDVVMILQGEGVTLEVTGSISIKHGVTSSTFASIPDAPISSFTLTLPEGPHSGLAAVLPAKAKGSLCGTALTMPFTVGGQNGAQTKQTVKIAVTGCPRAKKKAVKKHKQKGKPRKK